MSDEVSDLVRRAQAGDRSAFQRLYEDHVGRIYALCLRLTGDPEEAMERTQDAFVRAWGKLGSFRGEAAFPTWLHRLAVNVVLTDRRSAGRRERRAEAAAESGPRAQPAPRAGLGVDLERPGLDQRVDLRAEDGPGVGVSALPPRSSGGT